MAIVRYAGTAPVAGTIVNVFQPGTQSPATIYADPLQTPLSNPFASDPLTGAYVYYAEQQAYDEVLGMTGDAPIPADLGSGAFGLIQVGATAVEATQAHDRLTLVAGLGIVFTPDAAAKAIVVAISGGAGITQLTGDVTAGPGTGSQAATIAAGAVTNAKLATMAEATLKGRAAGAGVGAATDLTATQATAILNPVVGDSGSGGTKGLVPAPSAGDAAANKFLKASGLWVAPTSGALILLEQHSASSSASLDFTAWYSTDYDVYQIDFVGLIAGTNNVNAYLRMSTNGGSSYDSGSNYGYADQWTIVATNGAAGSNSAAFIFLFDGVSSAATSPLSGSMRLFAPGSTTAYKTVLSKFGAVKHDGNMLAYDNLGVYKNTAAVNAFQFLFSSGVIASGTIRIYGVVK